MKKTGLSYIPYVSDDWDVKRIRHLTSFVYRGVAPDYTDDTTRPMVVNQATFSQAKWDISKVRYTKTKLHGCRGRLKKGDVLLASTGGGVLGKTFFFEENEDNYIADSHVTILRPNKNLDAKFIYYFFSISYDMINDLLAKGSTNQTELQRNLLRMLEIPAPKKEEQERIVLFLDKEIPKIENILVTLKKEVETLSAAKKSLITECISKGIKCNVELKDTHVKWIGKIPHHWECKRIKYIGKVHSSKRIYESEYVEEGIPFFRTKEIVELSKGKEISLELFITEERYNQLKNAAPKKNDVIISSIGTIGAVWISDGRRFFYKDGNLTQINANDNFVSAYMKYFIQSQLFTDAITYYENTTTISALTIDKINKIFMPLPSKNEQQEIVDYLDKKCGAIDRIIEAKTKQIEKLEIHKQSMIYDYVTGAKRVGGTA